MAREKHLFIVHDEFVEAAEKLEKNDKVAVFKTLRLLKTNDQHPSLNVEPVKGSKSKVWSCRVTQNIRIIFPRIGDLLEILYVGRHDDAYRFGEKVIPIASMAALIAAGASGVGVGAMGGAVTVPVLGAVVGVVLGGAVIISKLIAEYNKKDKKVRELDLDQIGKYVLGLSATQRLLARISGKS
jgi:Txe/YoeB family toxin of Txe-Axe toxin-antitoxin module